MCGIAEKSDLTSAADPNLSHKMASVISHRGPDGSDIWYDSYAALAHTRLAIRGLGVQGSQPTISIDKKFVSVFNGEIYNFDFLKKKLQREHGVQITGDCDFRLSQMDTPFGVTNCLVNLKECFQLLLGYSSTEFSVSKRPYRNKTSILFQNRWAFAIWVRNKGYTTGQL